MKGFSSDLAFNKVLKRHGFEDVLATEDFDAPRAGLHDAPLILRNKAFQTVAIVRRQTPGDVL